MDYRAIHYFLQLCSEANMTNAAKKLYITQQGLSKAIKNLEEEIGFPLFYRGKSGFRLTPQGREFHRLAVEFRDWDTRMQNCVARLRHEGQHVRIGITMGVMLSLGSSALDTLREALAPITIDLVETMDFACEDAVESEELDFGITVGPVDTKRFSEVPLIRRPMFAVVGHDNPLSSKSTISISDLQNEKIILANKNFKSYYNFILICEKNGFIPNIVSTTMEMMVIYTQSRNNQGVGISADLPWGMVEYPGVSLIPFNIEEFPFELCLITPRGKRLNGHELRIRDAIVLHMR